MNKDEELAWYLTNCEGVILAYSEDESKIEGICLYAESPSYKTLFVNQILTITKRALKVFILAFKTRYPDWSIEANRKNRGCKSYTNTNKLIRRLELCLAHN